MGAAKLTIEEWPLEKLLPYAANARTHPKEQLEQLEQSIRQFGFNAPCLVDDAGILIAGHGRLMAAKKAGLKAVPVIRLGHLTEAQTRAFRLADNRIALNSEWDEDLLAAELAALDTHFDLEGLGFDADELDGLLNPEPGEGAQDGEDEAPALGLSPAAQPGDVWLLGPHRVVCGDSTDKAAVEACVGRETPQLMVTDPPYGVEYDSNWRLEAGINKIHQTLADGAVMNDNRADWTAAWQLYQGDVAYVWHAGRHASEVQRSLEAGGLVIRSQLIWAKNSLVMGRGDYHWQHEPCWYAVRKGKTGHWAGDRKQSTLWQIQNMHRTQGNVDDGKTNHSTQKPVECMRRPMLNNSKPGDAVYDPFLGSGTSVIAAETEARRCFGIELNPVYVDVIIKRWQDFTGKIATLQGDGRSFADVALERLAKIEAAA